MAEPTMRLDRFLWFARLAKTRTLAQALASDGHLRLNGRAIGRSHAAVRIGDVLTFAKAGEVRALRVETLPTRRGPAPEARSCYAALSENDSQAPACD